MVSKNSSKVDFRVPACIDNVRQIFLQNLSTIETLKIQNVVSDPEGIGKIEGLVAACKKLKDLKIICNLKYFEDEPARDFPQGFAETLSWYLANEGWWQPLLERAKLNAE